jgi:hypothetical protein
MFVVSGKEGPQAPLGATSNRTDIAPLGLKCFLPTNL